MLPVLYGCDTWLLILWEEYRARVFENGVLRNILGPKSNEAAQEWRKLHKEQHNKLCFSPRLFGCSNEDEWERWGM